MSLAWKNKQTVHSNLSFCYFEKLTELIRLSWMRLVEEDVNDLLTCEEESWSGCLRRTDAGIFFRTRVTPLGFSRSFFTRFALLQPTLCSTTEDYSGSEVTVSLHSNSKCTKTIPQLLGSFDNSQITARWYEASDREDNMRTRAVHVVNTHHYLVIDLNHFIASQDLHIDIRRRL